MSFKNTALKEVTGGAQWKPEKARFQCRECGFVLFTELGLSNHMLTHESQFVCNHCDFVAKDPFLLRDHKQIHRNRIKRELSEFDINRASGFNHHAHGFQYKKQTPGFTKLAFKCTECTFSTNTNQHLQDHRMFAHLKAKESTYFLNVVPLKPQRLISQKKTYVIINGKVVLPEDLVRPCFVNVQRIAARAGRAYVVLRPTIVKVEKNKSSSFVKPLNRVQCSLKPCFVNLEPIRLDKLTCPIPSVVKTEKIDLGYTEFVENASSLKEPKFPSHFGTKLNVLTPPYNVPKIQKLYFDNNKLRKSKNALKRFTPKGPICHEKTSRTSDVTRLKYLFIKTEIADP